MDELDKKFDEKLSSFKCDLVSDLKKEIKKEVKVIMSDKNKEIELLKLQVTLLQNHVSTVKHTLKVLNIKLTKNLRKIWEK